MSISFHSFLCFLETLCNFIWGPLWMWSTFQMALWPTSEALLWVSLALICHWGQFCGNGQEKIPVFFHSICFVFLQGLGCGWTMNRTHSIRRPAFPLLVSCPGAQWASLLPFPHTNSFSHTSYTLFSLNNLYKMVEGSKIYKLTLA